MTNAVAPRHLSNHDDWLSSYQDVLTFATTQNRIPRVPAATSLEFTLAAWVEHQRILRAAGSEALTRRRSLLLERIPGWRWADD